MKINNFKKKENKKKKWQKEDGSLIRHEEKDTNLFINKVKNFSLDDLKIFHNNSRLPVNNIDFLKVTDKDTENRFDTDQINQPPIFFSSLNSTYSMDDYKKNYENNLFLDEEKEIKEFKKKLEKLLKNDVQQNDLLFDIKLHEIKIINEEDKKKEKKGKKRKKRKKNFTKKLKCLKKLLLLLKKIFKNEKIIPNDLKLKKIEMMILNYILQRKFGKKLRENDLNINLEDKLILVNKILRTRSYKRPEECYKFIFSRSVKYLKSEKNKNIMNSNFYDYYFKEESEKEDISIFEYYYPFVHKNKKQNLNGNFFKMIFKSHSFKNDFLDHLKLDFLSNFEKEIDKKLFKLLKKWDSKFDSKNKKIIIKHIKNYILKNLKSKIPWSFKEVNLAMLRMESIVHMN